MAKIHSFYISNLKNNLQFYEKELSESELYDSALELTIYTNIENNNTVLDQNNVLESFQYSNSDKLEIRSMVNLSYKSFGRQGNIKMSHLVKQESGNMDFDPIAIVKNEL
ncbi:6210_t:CDS:1 [Cetraspora pellucida]|uniref:6210_t:CDS:1 n=1 Tax=Cetraspora pellucida TaxID=1433469 RepID=A0A9N9BVK6_9GLOM|nr:6210_t:CDS:1 [Cetraspora pellucida]